MKKVLFAMLVSGMLFSCTNNTTETAATADSIQVTEGTIAPVEIEEVEEVDSTTQLIESDSAAEVVE